VKNLEEYWKSNKSSEMERNHETVVNLTVSRLSLVYTDFN
jgi:hypothetical protein